MRNILITEEQFRTLLKEYSIDDQVHFGEPVAINAYQVHMPVEIDGKEYTIDEINFIIEPKKSSRCSTVSATYLYRPRTAETWLLLPYFQGIYQRIWQSI